MGASRTVRSPISFDGQRCLHVNPPPTLGEHNALYANGYRGTKQLTLKRIEGSYHFIMQDQPTRFAEALDAFLSETSR